MAYCLANIGQGQNSKYKTMKTLILLFTLIAGWSMSLHAKNDKVDKEKPATTSGLSVAQEMELFQDYFPDERVVVGDLISIQIFDSNFELIMEGQINPMEEIQNEELNKYMQNSYYLMSIGKKALYILEK